MANVQAAITVYSVGCLQLHVTSAFVFSYPHSTKNPLYSASDWLDQQVNIKVRANQMLSKAGLLRMRVGKRKLVTSGLWIVSVVALKDQSIQIFRICNFFYTFNFIMREASAFYMCVLCVFCLVLFVIVF